MPLLPLILENKALIISVLYAVLCEVLAHSPNAESNSLLQLLKGLLGKAKASVDKPPAA